SERLGQCDSGERLGKASGLAAGSRLKRKPTSILRQAATAARSCTNDRALASDRVPVTNKSARECLVDCSRELVEVERVLRHQAPWPTRRPHQPHAKHYPRANEQTASRVAYLGFESSLQRTNALGYVEPLALYRLRRARGALPEKDCNPNP